MQGAGDPGHRQRQPRDGHGHAISLSSRASSNYKGASRIRKRTLLGPYRRLMPGVIRGERFLMGEVPGHRQRQPRNGHGHAISLKSLQRLQFRGTSLIRNDPLLGPYIGAVGVQGDRDMR